MGYSTELGATMAVKILAVVLSLASLALAEPGYGYGAAYHPYGGYSYTHRSPQGLHGYHHHGYYGKREAEPSYGAASVYVAQADHGYHPSFYSYGFNSYGYNGYNGYNAGNYHKREADPEPGYGYGHHATSYYHRSPQGLHGYHHGYYGKREAEPSYSGYHGGYHGGVSYQYVSRPYVSRPYSHYSVHQS